MCTFTESVNISNTLCWFSLPHGKLSNVCQVHSVCIPNSLVYSCFRHLLAFKTKKLAYYYIIKYEVGYVTCKNSFKIDFFFFNSTVKYLLNFAVEMDVQLYMLPYTYLKRCILFLHIQRFILFPFIS